ncbi:MAG: ABC transporter permease [Clostridia bacterium]|nr:ABC transporter permease [Clostridia bacterium]
MSNNEKYKVPSLFQRIISVWYRHVRVYTSNFLSNAFPPFFEPLIFLAGLGIGIGGYIQNMGTMSYILFLASGLIVTSAMFSASFECTYGTFIRLEYDKVYDGMLGSPISPNSLIVGEIFFAGSKGFFFSFAVLVVIWAAGIISYPLSLLTTVVGFITGVMFGTLSMLITSFVKNINHFNFYFTGLLSPMFFFSGVVFPLENLPKALLYIAEILPLTHVVRMARAFCYEGGFSMIWLYDLLYCVVFIAVTGFLAVRGLKKRMIT